MSPRMLPAYALLLCLSASQALPTHMTKTTRPQTRDEMCATLLRGMQRVTEMHGATVVDLSPEDIEMCRRMVDAYLLQSQHPLRLKYGDGLEALSQDQIRALYAEVAGTHWETVSLLETPFQDMAFYLGHSGPWFPPIEQTVGKAGGLLAGLLGLLASLVTLGGIVTFRRSTTSRREDRVGGALDFYAQLCPDPETRENVQASAADLRRDVRELRAQGCSRWKVRLVRICRTAAAIGPIAWDGFARSVRAVMSVVREFIPPRAG